MNATEQELRIKRYFLISALIKGLISLGEVATGLLFFLIPTALIPAWVGATSLFIAVFLLTRGLIKLGLVAALIKNLLWAYPLSLMVLGLFIIYQTYEIIITHSVAIIAITLFDLVFVYLVWREYLILREHLSLHPVR
jgi:uncharacterized membrane protein